MLRSRSPFAGASTMIPSVRNLDSPTASATLTYGYDNLGRPSRITRPLGSGTNQHVTYAYDLHGWPTGITSNSFSESLYYASGLGTPRYNGNISSICWQNNNYSIQRGYKFTYDLANRLTQGAYGEGSSLMSNTNKFRESVQYDAATGNITGITRNGATSSYGYGLIDDLTLSYDGYRLTGVSETISDSPYAGTIEYKRTNGSQYIYDANGSLIADKSRGIAYIVYNSDNNPVRICFTNGNETKYVYSAGGQKLRVAHYVAKPNITRTFGQIPPELTSSQELYADSVDYMLGGSLLLKNGYVVDKYLFDGGYAQASGSITDSFSFYYYNKDHLGNNREVVDANGTVKQVVNYYPFGGLFGDPSSMYGSGIQLYKYNGKEFDNMHGLNTYDYGARQYDPILARWDRVDPLAEKYYSFSPYAYCVNNPINFIDENGDSTRVYVETNQLGHAWLSVGEGKDMVIYSYGRYNGTDKGCSFSNGDGVLLKLTGENAKDYMNKKKKNGMNTFVIDDVVDDEVKSYVDNIFNSSTTLPDERSKDYNGNPSAHVIDKYKLFSNNCTTFVSDVLNKVGSDVLNELHILPTSSFGTYTSFESKGRFINPRSLLKHLNNQSQKTNSHVYKR